jgi:hypothetical protein
MKLPDFESPSLQSPVRQKVPILDFQSEFSISKNIRFFLKKISCKKHFLLTSILKPQNLVISFDYSLFLAKNLAFQDPYSLLGEK